MSDKTPNPTWADGLSDSREMPSSAATADGAAQEAPGSSEWVDQIPIGTDDEEIEEIEDFGNDSLVYVPPIEPPKIQQNTFLLIQQQPTSWQGGQPLHKPIPHYAVQVELEPLQAPPSALPPQAEAQEAAQEASSNPEILPLTSLDINVLHERFPPMQQQTCRLQGSMPQAWRSGLSSAFVPYRPTVDPENDPPGAQALESLVHGQPTGALSGRGHAGRHAHGRGRERRRARARGHGHGHGHEHERGPGRGHGAPLLDLAPTRGAQSMLGQDVGVLPGTSHDDNAPGPLLDLNPEFRESPEPLRSTLFSQFWKE
ncbi:GL15928 [Drosophila persimilis]|uniref:GL15928 n=1 Tax=Drosophila persimilis TaxID=7234 RepID=B4H0R5_DROPE|nr:uncharacterized protein LOC6599441 [Drosophila persimilis]EDW29980.1 GL15928 [Drosophila persimilis]